MDPLQIVLIVVAIAAVWLLVELALLARRGRETVQNLDSTVGEINETLAEAKPVIAKLDDALEELQPAVQRVEPLLVSANVAVDALSANLVEVEAVVRDVASFTDTAVSAKNAARDMADSASGAVQRLFGKKKHPAETDTDRALAETSAAGEAPAPAEGADEAHEPIEHRYYTYDDEPAANTAVESDAASRPATTEAGEDDHE